MPRHLLIFALLCLALVQAQVTPDSKEVARQLAAGANDSATTRLDRQAALTRLQESAQLFLSAGENIEAARVLNRVGRLQLLLNSPQDAINSHNQALDLLKSAPSVEVEVDNLNGLAAAYMYKDRTQVDQYANRARELSEQAGYTRGQAQALLRLANRQNYEDHRLSLKTAELSLGLWTNLADKEGMAQAFEQIGTCYLAQNMLAEATDYFEKQLQLWRELGNSGGQAGALINLGFIDYRKAEWQKSISRYLEAQPLIDEVAEPEKVGQIATGLAEVFTAHGQYEEGLIHFNRALEIFRPVQDPHATWYLNWAIGDNYYRQEKYPEALSHFGVSLSGIDIDGFEAAASKEGIGRVQLAVGEYPAARQAFEFARDAYLHSSNWAEAARAEALLGQVLEYQGQLAGAQQNYQNALKTFERLSDPVNAAAVYFALGRMGLQRKDYEKAEGYLSRSLQITESMHRVSESRDLTMAFSASVHDRYQAYIECLMGRHQATPTLGLDIQAFETSEAARARSLAEFLQATHTNFAPGLDPELAQREKSLRQSLRQRAEYRTQLLSAKTPHPEELKAVEAELSGLEADYNQVIATIHTRYPDYEQIIRPVNWNLDRIQQEVVANDDTVLLEYSLGNTKSYAWAITRNGIKTFELPGQARITQAATTLYELLKLPPDEGSDNRLEQATRELSKMILSPMSGELDKQMFIVVADGALNYIPFQILRTPSSPNDPLVAKHNVVNVPSASVLGDLRQEAGHRQPATQLLAAFGDPVFYSRYAKHKDKNGGDPPPMHNAEVASLRDLELSKDRYDPSVIPRLFYAARELTNLRELTRGQALVISDVNATRQRFFTTDLTKYAILHLATHGGFLDPKRPDSAGFLLSTTDVKGEEIDGFVGLEDIYDLHAPVNLVVLSACQTALGKDVRGEGLVGLTRGFMYAGASSVVASLWKVDDAATAELMKYFYSNLLQHQMQPAEALGAAQNSIRQDSRWSSPYYWAAFTLQGEYREVIKPLDQSDDARVSWVKLSLIVAFVMLLAMAMWYLRSRRGVKT
jgi:CHAT domain-containing protein/tetratricopeptide (TPR) repeat protein